MIQINKELATVLQGLEYLINCFCNPVQDVNDNWFISSQEAQALNIEGIENVFIAKVNPLPQFPQAIPIM